MNKFPIVRLFTMAAVLAISISSCDREEAADTVKPVINLIEPEEGDVLQIGSSVHFEMELSDNEKLHSYKVDIHNNFDGHTHTKAEAEDDTFPFAFTRSWTEDVEGKKNADIHHHEIEIPENATPGAYHLEVYCTDAAGNEAHVAINIELSHEGEEHHHDEDEE
jgi:uncharacterized membrane protein